MAEGDHQALEVVLLRKIADDVSAVTAVVGDIRERVTRIESQGAIARIERNEIAHAELTKRIERLEAERERRTGMTTLTNWIIKSVPWVITGVAAGIAVAVKVHL